MAPAKRMDAGENVPMLPLPLQHRAAHYAGNQMGKRHAPQSDP